MGVVRREGAWRLEKQQDGCYEITHEGSIQRKVLTSDYETIGFDDQRMDFTVPVDEVESFSDVEVVFDRVRGAGSSSGFGAPETTPMSGSSTSSTAGDEELPDLPPAGVALVGLVGGGYLLFQSGFDTDSISFLLGGGLLVIGVLVTGFAYLKYRSGGADAAMEFLQGSEETEGSPTTDETNEPNKTPPTPQSLKDELYFERADRHCEYCDTQVDSPDVHHIVPRKEGGPNDPSNLVVLCPNCHRKADRGVISQSKLRYHISD
jgi:hypothetical protein